MKSKKIKSTSKPVNVNYPVGDFLIRLKNAVMAGRGSVSVSRTNLIKEVAEALKKEGFLEKVEENEGKLVVALTIRKKEPVLMDVKHVSKPGLRIYMGVEELAKRKSPAVLLVSTSKGILTAQDAIKKRVGGELIAEIL